jgi:hypothetical protein
MQAAASDQVIRLLPHIVPVGGQASSSATSANATGVNDADLKEVHENAQIIGAGDGSSNGGPRSSSGDLAGKKDGVGRNDSCPCGSGKKFKKCGALNTEEHQRLMANKK